MSKQNKIDEKIYQMARNKVNENIPLTDEALEIMNLPEVTRLIDLLLIEIPADAITDYLKHLPEAQQRQLPKANDYLTHVLYHHKSELKTNYKGAVEFVKNQLMPVLQKVLDEKKS